MRADTLLARIDGLTYRRLDYWIRTGLIRVPRSPWEGSGIPRDIPDGEVSVLRVMTPLVLDGVTPPKAEKIARELIAKGRATFGGCTLTQGASE